MIREFNEGEELPSTEILLLIHKPKGVSLHWFVTGEGTKRLVQKMPLVVEEECSLCGLA